MSTDHFQTKYASFMEVLVKSTITETTKLFETVVDELKTEISKLKAENEALKTTCRQKAEDRTIAIVASGQSSLSTMQDSAVQCDLGPLFLLAEPVGLILNEQGKHCNEEEMVYLLLNGNNAADGENSNLAVSCPNHEDTEPTVVSRNLLCTPAEPPLSSSSLRFQGLEIDQQCPKYELRKSRDTQVTTVHSSMEEKHNLHAAQNRSIKVLNGPGLLGTNENVAPDSDEIRAEMGTRELQASEIQMNPPSFGETAGCDQDNQSVGPTMPDERQEEERVKCGLMEDKTQQLSKFRKQRKQPSENVKHLPKYVKETLLLPPTCAGSTASSQPSISHPLEMHQSAVTLQDAILLVEAMDRSKDLTSSRDNATAQDRCSPSVVTAPSVVRSPSPTQASPSLSPLTDDECDNGAEEESTKETILDTRAPASPQNCGVGPSGVTPTFSLNSTASKLVQCASHPPSVVAEPFEPAVGSDLVPKKIFVFSKSPSTYPQGTIAPLSPNQISAVVSTVAAARVKCTLPASSSSGLSQRNDEDTVTSAPLVRSEATIASTEHRAGPMPCKKIKIIIRRTSDVATSQPQLSEAVVSPTLCDSVVPTSSSQRTNTGAQVTSCGKENLSLTDKTPFILPLSPPQLEGSSVPTNVCERLEQTAEERTAVATESALINCFSSIPQSECSSEPANVGERLDVTPGGQASGSVTESVPVNGPSSSPQLQCSSEPASVDESLELSPGEHAAAVVNDSLPMNCPSSSPQSEHSSEQANFGGSLELCSGEQAEEILTASVPVNCPSSSPRPECSSAQLTSVCEGSEQTSGEEAAALSAESVPTKHFPLVPVIRLKRLSSTELSTGSALVSQRLSPESESSGCSAFTPPSVEKTLMDVGMEEISALSNQARKTFTQDEKVNNNAEGDLLSPNDFPNALQFIPISKDLSEPHLQMSKTQFLAQLAVTPVSQDAKKIMTNESADVQRLQSESIFAHFGIHLKTRSQAKRAKTNAEPILDKMHAPESTKKPRLESASASQRPSAQEPETECSRGNLSDRQTTDISYFESQNSSEKARTSIRSLSRLSLEDAADGTLGTATLPHTEISVAHLGPMKPLESASLKMGDPTEHIPINARKSLIVEDAISSLSKPGSGRKRSLFPKETHSNCPRNPPDHKMTPPPSSARLKRSQLPHVSQTDSRFIKTVPRSESSDYDFFRSCNFSRAAQLSKLESNLALWKISLPGTHAPESTRKCASSRKTGESPSKKPRLNEKFTVEDSKVMVQNPKKLSKVANTKDVVKDTQTKVQKIKAVSNHHSDKTGNKYTQTLYTSPEWCAKKVKAPTTEVPVQSRAAIPKKLLKNQCGVCGRILSSSASLESHESLHTGHRPFCCAHCGKTFPDAKGLKRHSIVHRNGRLHICQQCGKGFVYGFGLNKHLQMVHGKIKPFVCQLCNKSFFTKRDVETHIRTHTGEKPFHCHLCDKKYVRSVELNAHLRWHSGEKRHWCPYCGKGFFDQNNLKRHKYIHTGEKPHSCPHCSKHFTQSAHLKKHVKNVHKIQY